MRSRAVGFVPLLLLLGLYPACAGIQNLVVNGSFEKPDPQHAALPLGFSPQRTDTVTKATSKGGQMTWEKTGHWGDRSLAIADPTAADFGYWKTTAAVKPNTEYVLSVYTRCQVRGGQPEIVVSPPGKSFKDPGGFDWYIPVSLEWTEYQHTYKTLPNQKQLAISLILYGRGGQKVWFDDLALVRADSLPRLVSCSPAAGAILTSTGIDFIFQPATTSNQYFVQWARNSYFNRGEAQSAPGTETRVKPIKPLAPGTWYWRVGALGAQGRPYFTPTQTFLISSGASRFQHADTTPPAVFDPSPPPDSTLAGHDFTVSAHFADAGSGIDVKSARLLWDGKDVTSAATVTEQGLSYEPKNPPRGVHSVQVTVRDAAGNPSNVCWWQFGVGTPVAVKGQFDKSGAFQLNGRTYFPLGLYSYCLMPGRGSFDETLLSRAAAAGFNAELVENTGSAEELKMLLKHGMKVMLQTRGGLQKSTDLAAAKAALVTSGPVRWKSNPALLGYWADEPDKLGPDKLRYGYEAIKGADPDHPTLWCLCDPSHYRQNSVTTDGLMPDIYPVPATPIPIIFSQLRQAITDSGNKPIWFIPQAFDWTITRGGKVTSPGRWRPTAQELRAMTYLGLVAGARGIFYWASDTSAMNDVVWYAAQWDELLKLASELRYLGPTIEAGRTVPGVKVTSTDQDVYYASWQTGGRRVLAVVNAATAPVEAHITLPGAKQVSCLFEDRKLTSGGGDFHDIFRPYQVHVYEW